ncbi:hypothetical protein OIU84_018201 [Salix udensis]|uniref:NYN domain-containing protein n=1 Tax=Salix udensis TaxID=889485 RepID=A0AAD6L4T8_9ROSI|nr:hypothetical protein OIU84_018201 [Salix udensis]
MLFWAVDNPAPANYLLISGDRDFSNALHQLRMRRYNILLAQPKTASAPLVAAAKSVWLWTSLLAGGQPLADGELQQPGSKNYTSSPGTAQIPVSGAAQMKEPVDSCSEIPRVANQISPSTARGNRWGGVQGNQSQTNTPFYPSAPPMPAGLNGTSFTRVPAFGSLNESTRRNLCQMNLDPIAPPPMSARPNGTNFTSASSTRVAGFDSANNFGHPVNASPQRRNPELKHDPKNKPDSKNNRKSKGESSKWFCSGKGPEISPNKKEQDGKNSEGFCAGKGPEPSQNKKKSEGDNSQGSSEGKGSKLEHDPQKKSGSQNKKKPEGENSKGSLEGKEPELEHDPQNKPGSSKKKKPKGENSKESYEGGKGVEIEHDPQKKLDSSKKKKPEAENSKESCEEKGLEMEHDPHKKPNSQNKKKPVGENFEGSCEGGKGPELEHDHHARVWYQFLFS